MRRLMALVWLASAVTLGAASPSAEVPTGAASPRSVARLSAEARDRFRVALGVLRSGAGTDAAREFADPSWASTPLYEYALLFEAESLLKAGDAANARAAIAQAADPASGRQLAPSALLQAASVLSQAGDDAGAVTLYRRFLDRAADHRDATRARFSLGQTLLSSGRLSEAARAFSEIWLHAPATPYAENAARQLQVLAERGLAGAPAPTPREKLERAERLLAAGLSEPAGTEAEALVGDGLPTDLLLRALKVLLEASRRAGHYDDAAAAVQRALAAAPRDRRAPWLLERARLEQRQSRDLALATLDKLVAEYRKSPEAAEALITKARLLEAAPKLAAARATYLKVAADYPDEEQAGAALWRLGWLDWFRGAHAAAAREWERLLAVRGGQPHREAAIYWIGRAHEQRGELSAAAHRYIQLLGEGPRSYYGLLAAQRSAKAAVGATQPRLTLPADPLESLQADGRYARVEALRAVELQDFADEEMEEMTRLSLGDPTRLYALSAAYAQEARYHLALRILRRHFQSVARSALGGVPRAFWEMFYPLGWRTELTEAADRAGVDPFLVAALVREESSFYPQARSRVGARGLMQLMPETARPLAQSRRFAFNGGDLLDEPGANLDMGTAFLAGLLREFGDPRLATAAYNAGPTRVREWWAARRSDDLEVFVEQIPFNETRGFVKRVMLSWDGYRRVYGREPGGEPPRNARR